VTLVLCVLAYCCLSASVIISVGLLKKNITFEELVPVYYFITVPVVVFVEEHPFILKPLPSI